MKGHRGLVISSGGTGFIGRALALELTESGNEVVVLTRDPQRVLPRALLKAGFRFSYPELGKALSDILR